MIPLYAFDLLSLRRIHPTTILGTAVIVDMHAVVSAYWNDAGWIERAEVAGRAAGNGIALGHACVDARFFIRALGPAMHPSQRGAERTTGVVFELQVGVRGA